MEEQGSIVTIHFDNGKVLESYSRIKTQEMKEIVNNLINEKFDKNWNSFNDFLTDFFELEE